MSKRREFPKAVRLAAWARSEGRCEACDKKLFPGKFVYDHDVPDALGGAPTLENCKVICAGEKESCNHKKTFGTRDRRLDGDNPKIAKANRIRRKRENPKKAKCNWPSRSLGNARYKKKLDGSVERRDAP